MKISDNFSIFLSKFALLMSKIQKKYQIYLAWKLVVYTDGTLNRAFLVIESVLLMGSLP